MNNPGTKTSNSATLQEAVVFEYCEEQYSQLKMQDGGYFAKKHDKVVFYSASQKFNMPVQEVDRIYNVFTKRAADIEIARMRKMPLSRRKKYLEQRAHDLFCENHDNPFYKIYGEPSGQLPNHLDILHDEYRQMVESVAAAGWTIPLSIDLRCFEQLLSLPQDPINLDSFFDTFYGAKEFRYACRKIKEGLPSPAKVQVFSECVSSYNQGMYSTCLIALISLLEGFISAFGDNPSDVRIMRVCNFHADAERNKGHHIKSLCWLSMHLFIKEIFQKSDFSQNEPDTMNRHWIQHGRTDRTSSKIECLKVFNALSTLTNIWHAENIMGS